MVEKYQDQIKTKVNVEFYLLVLSINSFLSYDKYLFNVFSLISHLKKIENFKIRIVNIYIVKSEIMGGGGGVTQKNPTPTLEKVRLG